MTMLKIPKFLALFCVPAAVAATTPAIAETARTIIVMDGSGSMWGQIDGRTKLEIARETVSQVLTTIPAEQELGLMAYGHREKGNCSDIELVVPPAPSTGQQIAESVSSMRFLGKTPLSESVRQAAEALKYSESAATVVLVTDGLETCNADPCALGRELEASGLNFTAHVIGFGLSQEEGAQVACLAEETGGKYLQAADATDLATALRETVSLEPPAETTPAPAPKVVQTAQLNAVETAAAGSRIAVSWTGPRSDYDYIRLFDAEGNWVAEAAVGEEDPLELQLPWLTGQFSLAYVLESEAISETRPLALTPAPVSITAPDTAQAGSEVTVTWVGPAAFLDNIQLLNADTSERLGYDYTDGKDSMVWTMPDAVGNYNFAYVFRDSEIIYTTPVSVVEEPATLEAPLSVVPVTFTGEGTDELELNVTWSATPSLGQNIPAEAWAMQEGTLGPVSADFLPGVYDVRGEAGDIVFAGQVTVTPEGPNEFIIPVSSELSPAGPDALPVGVTFTGPYMGTFRQWAAFDLGSPDGTTMISDGLINTEWSIELQPSQWLITATADGATGPGLAAVVSVSSAGTVEIDQPRFGVSPITDGGMFHRKCDGEIPCSINDEISGIRLILLPGWKMQDPYPLTTAAGVSSPLQSTLFSFSNKNDPLVALNPRQRDASLGPCEQVAAGELCRLSELTEEEMSGYRAIAFTVQSATIAAPEAVIDGERLNLDPETAIELRNRLLGQP